MDENELPARHRRPTKKTRPRETVKAPDETLAELLERLGIHEWDWVIAGDGSGSDWKRACGWAAVAIERETGERLFRHGAANCGSVNFAELMAYLNPLCWIANREQERRDHGGRARYLRIYLLTDSQYVVQAVRGDSGGTKNAAMLRIFSSLKGLGFHIEGVWAPRESTTLNQLVDGASRAARLHIQAFEFDQDPGAANP